MKGDYYLYLHEIVFRAYVTKGHVTSAGGREPIVILIKRNREFFLFLVMKNRSDHPPEDDIHMYSTAPEKGKRWQCSKKEWKDTFWIITAAVVKLSLGWHSTCEEVACLCKIWWFFAYSVNKVFIVSGTYRTKVYPASNQRKYA